MSTVAVYGGGGAPYNHAAVLARAGHRVEFVFPVDILDGALEGYDALIVPGGGYQAMQGQMAPLGVEGARRIRSYVEGGGMYVGSCAGSFIAADTPASFRLACPAQSEMCLLPARIWNSGDEWDGVVSPGIGRIRVTNHRPDHPVMRGLPPEFEVVHYNGPLFIGGEHLSVVEGATERFTPSEAFLDPGYVGPTLIEGAAEAGAASATCGAVGDGRVVLFGSHPEFGYSLAMDDEQVPALMLRNAIAWQAQAGAARGGAAGPSSPGAGGGSERVHELVPRVRARIAQLASRGVEPAWLDARHAMSMFGVGPRQVWTAALTRMPELLEEIDAAADGVRSDVLTYAQPAEWGIDVGYHGVVPLLEQTEAMLDLALERWAAPPPPTEAGPYGAIRDSPYHLVAGSYLSAVGRVTAAALLCRAFVEKA